jgi:ABC-type lipoprotein release transport system permease subunit
MLVGLGAGLAASTMVGRLLEHQLYGVTRFDFSTLLATCALMIGAGLLASWLPARRAATMMPASALHDS